MTTKTSSRWITVWVDALIILLALTSLFLFFVEVLTDLTPEQLRLLQYLDLGIAGIFLVDFTIRLVGSDAKVVFLKRNWWQLLASVPVTGDLTPALRGLMILRLSRLLRLVGLGARVKWMAESTSFFLQQTYLVSISVLSLIFTMSSALAFHLAERHHNPQVETFMDSLWWSVSALTTTGVEDVNPITAAGRIISMVQMVAGLIFFGVFTAFLISFLVRRKQERLTRKK